MLTLYVIDGCPFCKKALALLESNQIKYNKKVVTTDKKQYYKDKNKHDSFPQLVLKSNKEKYILGGSEAVEELVGLLKNKL